MSSNFYIADGAAMFSKQDDWETPQQLFDELDAEFHFTLDAASTDGNAKCDKHYTEHDSAFNHSWGGGDRVLQPAIWAQDGRLDTQMLTGSQQAKHYGRAADTSANGHQMVPRLHTAPCRGSFPTRTPQIRARWQTTRAKHIPQHDRHHANWRTIGEIKR